MNAASARSALATWLPRDPAQNALRDEYLAFLDARGDSALDRDGGPDHLTASLFVITPERDRVLLCFHRKGGFWVQLGGHVEALDRSLAAAALREGTEESGLDTLAPLADGSPVDVDRHALGGAFGRCRVHWDVGFAAVASAASVPVASDESEDVAWWPVDALPAAVPPGFERRLRGALAELETQPTR